MVKINVDCNYNYLGPSKPVLTKYEVAKLGLQINQRVIAYQDEDEWYGTIKFDETFPAPMSWYIELDQKSGGAIEQLNWVGARVNDAINLVKLFINPTDRKQ